MRLACHRRHPTSGNASERCWRKSGMILTGRSSTTCAAPGQNGGRSNRAAPGSRARSRRKYQSPGARRMTITEYVATTTRAFMTAEIAMAAVNCGAANVTRAQAEKLVDDYFARVEQVIPWTEINSLDRRS